MENLNTKDESSLPLRIFSKTIQSIDNPKLLVFAHCDEFNNPTASSSSFYITHSNHIGLVDLFRSDVLQPVCSLLAEPTTLTTFPSMSSSIFGTSFDNRCCIYDQRTATFTSFYSLQSQVMASCSLSYELYIP